MFCEECGSKINTEMKFCKTCGKKTKTLAEQLDEIKTDLKSGNNKGLVDKLLQIEDAVLDKIQLEHLRGDAYFISGEYTKALESYNSINKKNKPWDILFNSAIIKLNTANIPEAIIFFEQLIGVTEEQIAQSVLYAQRYKDRKVLLLDVNMYLGVLYKNAGNAEGAIKSFKRALECKPESELVHANLGDLYFNSDTYDKAIKYYQNAIGYATDVGRKSRLYNDIGLSYFRKGIIEEAVVSFKKAITLDSENQNAIYNLGIIYTRGGMNETVKKDFEELLKLESGVNIIFHLTKSMMNVAKKEMFGEIKSEFIGESDIIKKVKDIILKAAATDSTVLIQGENGTGKELVARAVHQLGRRAEKPFIVVNCGALPENLLESELFGYEKGAFTGAVGLKKGRFEIADTGTIFLDEIGDITPAMQVKLLRFVQEREFERVGGTDTIKVNIRIIAATNRDLKALVEEGKFREDLYYRLYVFPIVMPPLRERGQDIALLADNFLKKFASKYEKKFRNFSTEASTLMQNYGWPGNVRQLENVIERIVTLFDAEEVTQEFLPNEILTAKTNIYKRANEHKYSERQVENPVIATMKETNFSVKKTAKKMGISEKQLTQTLRDLDVKEVLHTVRGSKTKAAKLMGMSRVALYKRLKKN